MVCPACYCYPAAAGIGFLSGCLSTISAGVARRVGINAPAPTSQIGLLTSGGATALLSAITAVALKQLVGFSLCGGQGLARTGLARIAVIAVPLSVVYNISVNIILDRHFPWSKSCCSVGVKR